LDNLGKITIQALILSLALMLLIAPIAFSNGDWGDGDDDEPDAPDPPERDEPDPPAPREPREPREPDPPAPREPEPEPEDPDDDWSDEPDEPEDEGWDECPGPASACCLNCSEAGDDDEDDWDGDQDQDNDGLADTEVTEGSSQDLILVEDGTEGYPQDQAWASAAAMEEALENGEEIWMFGESVDYDVTAGEGVDVVVTPIFNSDGDFVGFNVAGAGGEEPEIDFDDPEPAQWRCFPSNGENRDRRRWQGGWVGAPVDCGTSGGYGSWSCKTTYSKARTRAERGCNGGSCYENPTDEDLVPCNYGCSAGKCTPHAAFTVEPNPTDAGDTITLDASDARDSYGGENLAYEWYYDDQKIGNGKTLQYDISSASIHEVRLEVRSVGMIANPEDNGTTDDTTQNLTVDEAPTSVINAPEECIVPCTGIDINAVGTTDAVDPPEALTYEWDYESDGTFDETFNDPNQPGEHLFDTVTTYTMTLRVTNTGGTWSEVTKDIDVINNNPVADFRLIPYPANGVIPLTILFVNQSTDPDGHLMTYLWEFGLGQGTSTDMDTEHVYSVSDQYDITLTVTDEYGGIGTKTGLVDAKTPAAITHFSATDVADEDDSTIVEVLCNKRVDAQLQILTVEGEPVLDETGQPIDGLVTHEFQCDEGTFPFPVPAPEKDGFPGPGVYQLVATIKNEICTNCPKVKFIIIGEPEQIAETPETNLALVAAIAFAVVFITGRKKQRA